MATMRRSALVILTCLVFPGFQVVCRKGDASSAAPVVGQPMPAEIMSSLEAAGWSDRTRGELGLWVSTARQQLLGIENGQVAFIFTCSTAAKGLGNRVNSYQTPTGWHEIDERIGDGYPLGAIFVERKFTGKVWVPEQPTEKDYVLTRIMWLRGLEPGVNSGAGIDSHERYIYIHGTPAEDKLGSPASLGCVRLSNKDVIEVFDRTKRGTKVLVTEW